MEFGYWEENFHQWSGFVDNGITSNEEADVFFNFDSVEWFVPEWMVPPMEEIVIEERETTKIVRNSEGIICEMPKDGHSTIARCIGSSINSPEDWEEVKRQHFNPESPERRHDITALQQRFPDDRVVPLGLHCGSMIGRVRNMLTAEGLAYAIYDHPLMVEDMIETCCILVEQDLDQVLPHVKFDFAGGWEDICFNNGPLVSVSFFERVIVPRYKRISERLRRHGIDVWYTDCDGDIRPLLPDFLDAGLNCMFPFEVSCCGHPGELLNEYQGELLILGGVDKMQITLGEPAIRNYLESLVPFVEKGGFIPFCDHRCPPTVSWDNYLRYLDIKQELFGGA
jgi:uroporphyrinogen decarboxylase